ncbi:hypothetical protein Tco_0420345 [Tanacetum coccineum]
MSKLATVPFHHLTKEILVEVLSETDLFRQYFVHSVISWDLADMHCGVLEWFEIRQMNTSGSSSAGNGLVGIGQTEILKPFGRESKPGSSRRRASLNLLTTTGSKGEQPPFGKPDYNVKKDTVYQLESVALVGVGWHSVCWWERRPKIQVWEQQSACYRSRNWRAHDSSHEIPKEVGVRYENFKVALHPNFPDQEVAIGGTLSAKGRTELCSLLKENLDIFAWQPSDIIGVP